MMNQYGKTAQQHWEKWLPARYQQIEDPTRFFASLGEEIQERVTELSMSLAGNDPPGETYMQKLGRLNMARRDAESQALQEMALLPPEAKSHSAT